MLHARLALFLFRLLNVFSPPLKSNFLPNPQGPLLSSHSCCLCARPINSKLIFKIPLLCVCVCVCVRGRVERKYYQSINQARCERSDLPLALFSSFHLFWALPLHPPPAPLQHSVAGGDGHKVTLAGYIQLDKRREQNPTSSSRTEHCTRGSGRSHKRADVYINGAPECVYTSLARAERTRVCSVSPSLLLQPAVRIHERARETAGGI